MSLVALALALGVLAALLLGGRLRHVAGTRLRSVGLLLGGAVAEFAGSRWGDGAVGTGILIAGYLLLVGFALRNLAITGMVLVAMGLLANLTVIALNGGVAAPGPPAR